MTHDELSNIVAKWLNKSGRIDPPCCPFVVVGLKSMFGEQPDVFGWCSWTSVLIEVKVSRGDFLADFRKPFRVNPLLGVGELRYYCCPKGLITTCDLPENWGLLWFVDGLIEVKELAKSQVASLEGERCIISSVMRREGLYKKAFSYNCR